MSAVKHDQGKPAFSHLPARTIEGVLKVFGFGAKKYERHNYAKGFNHTRALDAAMRHLMAIYCGEDIDPESGLPHIYHAICSLIMYDHSRRNYPELDDRMEKP